MVLSRKGFTLIELLIVVAIIGILAAIAIPNFLAAQTRAKVASQQSNVRTLAMGAQEYFIDYGDYPPWIMAFNEPTEPWTANARFPYVYVTTPIEYISDGKNIIDRFTEQKTYQWYRLPAKAGTSCVGYNWAGHAAVVCTSPDDFSYRANWYSCPVWYGIVGAGSSFILFGTGPTGRQIGSGPCQGTVPDVPYDPTNGTISEGHIARAD